MTAGRARLLAMLAPGAALAVWGVAGAVLLRATLGPDRRPALDAAVAPLVASHGMLVVVWWLGAAACGAWVVARIFDRQVAPVARLAAATRVLAGDAEAPEVPPLGGAGLRDLAAAVNALAAERRSLQDEMAGRVAEASARVAEQRDQLGALMAELQQAVLVCNREGRILLYNGRAKTLLRGVSRAPGGGAGGSDLVGLGRSIHGVIDRPLIDHALETVARRLSRGDAGAARFVTATAGGTLLRVSLAPVRHGEGGMTGYVLLLDDITREQEAHGQRDRRLLELTEASRASFASMQAALDMLDYPDLEPEERERFQAVVRDEVGAMSARLAAAAAGASEDLKTRWPLQEMLGADLLLAAARRIEAEAGQAVAVDAADPGLWLDVDSFALLQALTYLAGRLGAALDAPALRLRLAPAGGRAHLDLVWSGGEIGVEALAGWQTAPMTLGETRSALSLRDVVERHGGELWIERDRARGEALFRFLLPVANAEPGEGPADGESRPAYYDFDLFAASSTSRDFDSRALTEIAYTVFDSETTGLDPANGDEILQIGATRIVNGKLLRGECFDQLVDPRRSIPEAGIPIHGIRPEMVRGKPVITEVLPAFHAFAADTVLVGHNVAFDLRFLKLKEAASGVIFDQPVLDTLLLASIVHPGEASHGLEAIAGRLGVSISGRHTALGDALATAEVFLRLLPLLRQQGITTLGEARTAAEASWYARLRY